MKPHRRKERVTIDRTLQNIFKKEIRKKKKKKKKNRDE
jgi:hypothetical protein